MSGFEISDLRPLDMIASWKDTPGLLGPFLDWNVMRVGRRLHPGGNVRYNHLRSVLGVIEGKTLGFEWTVPAARFILIEPWMIDACYGRVFRYVPGYDDPDWALSRLAFDECLKHDGTIYDLGQLIDVGLGRKIFDFGKDMFTCSVGGRDIWEGVTHKVLSARIPKDKTLPCFFANSEEWEKIN